MREEVKELWIAALESGDYEQGRGQLRTEDDARCCLGVLCELAVKAGVIPPADKQYGVWAYADEELLLPGAVATWAGFTADPADEFPENSFANPIVPNPDYHSDEENAHEPELSRLSLAELNDADAYTDDEMFVHRYPFPAIANLIREHL